MANGSLVKIVKIFYKYIFRQFKDEEILKMLMNEYVKQFILLKKDFFFIQIGSNNGKNNDPLFDLVNKYGIKGILIEPVPYIYDKLKENYKKNDGLIFENVAIGQPNEGLKFYRLKKSENTDIPFWYDQLGSFNKEVILKHKDHIPNMEELLIEEPVEVRSFEYLIKKHNVGRINLIHIDTEGYDYEVIKLINFDEVAIDVILFENNHLSAADYAACIELLRKNKFNEIVKLGHDTMCIHENQKDFLPVMNKVLKYRK
ncbi:MAG: FkbM family methyltransferase [Chitinophagaceae bacterium]